MNTKLAAALIILVMLPMAACATTAPVATGVGLNLALTNYDPSPAKPGQYVTLYLKAQNSGGSVIKDAVFQLDPIYPFSLKADENATKYVSSIGAQEDVLLEYHLYVDKSAIADTYTMHLKLCLDSACASYLRTPFDVSVQTGGTPRLEIGLESSDNFAGGTKGTITLHTVNRGLLNVKFLSIELQSTDQFTVLSAPTTYIGELKSDDFETAEYTIYVKKNVAVTQSETIKLPVLVEYSDANDKEYSEMQEASLNVYSKVDMVNMGLASDPRVLLGQIALIIAGIFLVFLVYKKVIKKKTIS